MTHGMNDEDFARALRSRIDSIGADVVVDTDAVLPRARRRRARRAAVTGAASVAAVALAAGWAVSAEPWTAPAHVQPAGPSMTTDGSVTKGPADGATSEQAPAAVLDREAGTITTPLDAWSWDSRAIATSETAVAYYVVQCLQDAGYEATFGGPLPADPGRDYSYGLWRMAEAETSGYANLSVPDEDVLNAVGANWDRASVPEGAPSECRQKAIDAGLTYDIGDFQDGPVGSTPATYTEEGRAIRDEWLQCLQEHGESAPRSHEAGWIPEGVFSVSPEEQVRIAMIDVGCKDELGTVQRIADLQAAQEADYVRRGAAYLERRHAAEEKALAASRTYLEDLGVSMPWWD